MKSHYDTLGVSEDAIPEVIKAAYRAMSQKYHPDINDGDAQANKRMTEINKAYEVLSSPEKKALYDKNLKSSIGSHSNKQQSNNFQFNSNVEELELDPLYNQAVEIVLKNRRASISLIQRHLRIGYSRAADLIEEMEQAGLVSAMRSNGNREVLIPPQDANTFGKNRGRADAAKLKSSDEELPQMPKKFSYLGPIEYISIIFFGLVTVLMIRLH